MNRGRRGSPAPDAPGYLEMLWAALSDPLNEKTLKSPCELNGLVFSVRQGQINPHILLASNWRTSRFTEKVLQKGLQNESAF